MVERGLVVEQTGSRYSEDAMAKASVEEQLEQLRRLRTSADDPTAVAALLRPYLQHANNLVVGKAADLARELGLRELVDAVAAAFRRFLDGPAKKDPQCWAKNALSKALHQLGHDDSTMFLEGLRVHQFEPVWGGQSDVAGTLRANCAHALVDCPDLSHHALLLHLLDVVADDDQAVRAEAVRAFVHAGGDSAVLLLRMRALTGGGEEPAVIGQCFAGVLALEGMRAVPFVAKFLAKQDEVSGEAAIALGETRTPEALKALLDCVGADTDKKSSSRPALEPWFATVLMSAMALTRQPLALETLLDLVEKESDLAEAAIEAIAHANYGADVTDRLGEAVRRLENGRIQRAYDRFFPR